MPSLSVFGAQWGDEGKGKIIDRLAKRADVVVRYQGGANAGHTVVVGAEKYVLHLIPSGILHEGKLNVIASGVALDPRTLLAELSELRERGVDIGPDRLAISARAHVIFEHHRRLDALAERWKGAGRIGTTGRGIGPCYADKSSRTGLRACDIVDPDRCRTRLRAVLAEKNALITQVHGEPPIDVDEEVERSLEHGRAIAPFLRDAGALVRDAHAAGQDILFEAAQGVMLDLDHGTYPFVTSSNTGPDGIAAGVGFPVRKVERATGIAKAYCTRVGEGPFPTEDRGPDGDRLREVGCEYGATTGRPRRCGWFDAVAVRYALALSGADSWIVTNLDVLTGFDELRMAIAYRRGDETFEEFPAELGGLEGVEPVYATCPGWTEDLTGVRRFEDLPDGARNYVRWIEERVGVPVEMLSVGPERDQVVPVPPRPGG
jgi:adenylosuccinate synthase